MMWSLRPVRAPQRRVARPGRLRACAAAVAGLVVLGAGVTACASGDAGGPLVLGDVQEGMSACMADSPSSGLPTWDAPVGYAEEMFWNKSARPLRVESVRLLDPHNLVLHGSVLYRMAHTSHALPTSWAWTQIGQEDPALWRARQRIPGAVMPPVGGPVEVNGNINTKVDRWEIVVDISAASPAGGWALGEVVQYQAGGQAYTLEAREGLSIGTSRRPAAHSCDGKLSAISAGFAALK
jgi:hypothetical protein